MSTKNDTKTTPKRPQYQFQPGNPGGPGRRKGQPNKVTADVREAILKSFNNLGAADYLTGVARTNPQAYMALLGKILPAKVEHTGEDGGPIATRVTVEFVG